MLIAPSESAAQSPEEVFKFAESLKRDQLFEASSQQFLKFAMENPNSELAPRALEEAADPLGNRTVWEALVQVAGGVVLGAGVYFLAAFILRCEEVRAFWHRLGLVRE